MLEQMRKSSQSLLIYTLFGIVIAVFIINFGPQARGGCEGEVDRGSYAVKVAGHTLDNNDFQYGYLVIGGANFPAQVAKQRRVRETVMDKLIERELLADEAERLGFHVGEDQVNELLTDGKIIGLGYPRNIQAFMKGGKFDYDEFKKFAQFQMRQTPVAFIEQQRRELLAFKVRELLRDGVKVSPDEVKTDFERRGNQVNLEYVRFSPRRYDGEVEPTAAEIAAYASANEKKLKDVYEQRKSFYQKVPRELRVRHILVKVDQGASPDTEDKAQKKAEALAARLKGGEAFDKVARAASDDARSKGRGGLLGWRGKGATGLGAAVEEKLFAAKEGEVVGPIKSAQGFELAVHDGTREGDLTFDKLKDELAESELRQEKTKARAKADADAAMAKAKAAQGQTLKELFPGAKEAAKDEDHESALADSAPKAEETGLFARRGAMIEGLGASNEVAKAVFELTTEAPLGGPYEISGTYVVLRLKEKKVPDMAEFDKKKDELRRDAELQKWEEVLGEWSLRRCMDAKERKDIDVNREILRYDDSPDGLPGYEPCQGPLKL